MQNILIALRVTLLIVNIPAKRFKERINELNAHFRLIEVVSIYISITGEVLNEIDDDGRRGPCPTKITKMYCIRKWIAVSKSNWITARAPGKIKSPVLLQATGVWVPQVP
jgi:hypothetical protein